LLGYDVLPISISGEPPHYILGKQTKEQTRKRIIFAYLHRKHLRQILRDKEIDLVLDVGGKVGKFGRMLRGMQYKGDIVSFEPVPENFSQLSALVEDDPRWQALPYALGQADEKTLIHVTRGTGYSSFLSPNEFGQSEFGTAIDIMDMQQVELKRGEDVLDSMLVKNYAPRIFLKLDTQGYDLEVFKGFGRFQRHIQAIQVEVSAIPIYQGMPDIEEAIQLFRSDGFGLAGFFPISTKSGTSSVIEFDCLLVR